MAKRKATSSSRNNGNSSKPRKSILRNRINKNGGVLSKFKEKIIGVLIMSILLTLIGRIYKSFILRSIYDYQCVEFEPGDFGVRLIHDAININHQLRENPNKKSALLRLLAEEVIWFKKGKIQNKNSIKFYSKYDEFCFAEKPIYDQRDDIDRNYQIRFVGIHKHRELGQNLIELENYFARIDNGKIAEIYPVPISALDQESFKLVNIIYTYYYALVFLFWVIILSATTYLVNLPEYVFNFLRSILQKFGL